MIFNIDSLIVVCCFVLFLRRLWFLKMYCWEGGKKATAGHLNKAVINQKKFNRIEARVVKRVKMAAAMASSNFYLRFWSNCCSRHLVSFHWPLKPSGKIVELYQLKGQLTIGATNC